MLRTIITLAMPKARRERDPVFALACMTNAAIDALLSPPTGNEPRVRRNRPPGTTRAMVTSAYPRSAPHAGALRRSA